ncbi:DNA internalization-related competence protein ComEC/Rec2 [Marinobacter salinisoli]|uniref:DNA internalization-related competence protein ComEC/Rec2 n=1 Tax=Marinobacter salinisoli TaxID=2769486 RepID=UPI00224BA61D|nr:DNA internalization-related competence protein ComEC/Rec2 [Marinobacter salinisoli]
MRSRLVRQALFVVGAFCAGMAWVAWHAELRLNQRLPAELEGVPVSVSGYVCDVPAPGSFDSLKFSFCVTHWHRPDDELSGTSLPDRLRLAWYGADRRWLPDHRLRLTVVLKRPHGALNPEGFRYEDWLFRHGYRATGSVRSIEPDTQVPCGLRCHYAKQHGQVVRWVQHQFAGARQVSLIGSLLVGYRGELEPAQWSLLRATGTIHLVAISGLHLGLIAVGVNLIAGRLIRRVPVAWMTESARRGWIYSAIAVSCLLYALVAGFTVPTQRALIMVLVGGWSLLLARADGVWRPLIYALGLTLVMDPFAPLDQGFWLSFAAVAVLIGVFSGRVGRLGWVRSLLMAQVAVFAGLWPALILVGQAQPLAGALANLVAIPWISLVVMPLLMIAGVSAALLPELAELFVPLLDGVLGVFWWWLSRVSELPFPDVRPGIVVVGLFALMILSVVHSPFLSSRLAAGFIALLWFCQNQSPTVNASVLVPEVRVWDVGQGMSILVRHQNDVLLYDTGPEVPGVFSAVESVILPNLRALGVVRVDTLVVSHADSDHAGGLSTLAKAFDVGAVVSGEPEEVREKLGPGLRVLRCDPGQARVGELAVEFWRSPGTQEGNDASCVLRVRSPDRRVEWILPGDISRQVEQEYLAQSQGTWDNAAARIMIAPHHGSKTSSSREWVAYSRPDAVIFSAGYRHRFGHPHRAVTARYREFGARLFSTACSGALTFSVDEDGLQISEAWPGTPFWIGGEGQTRGDCKIP